MNDQGCHAVKVMGSIMTAFVGAVALLGWFRAIAAGAEVGFLVFSFVFLVLAVPLISFGLAGAFVGLSAHECGSPSRPRGR